MGGAELVRQGHRGFLNHTFDPHPTAKRFEYSTSSIALAAGLLACVQELPLRYGVEAIEAEIQRLRALFLELIDRDRYTPLEFAEPHRSSILSLICRDDPMAVAEQVMDTGNVMMTVPVRGGYLRFAPHFATTDEEVERAAHALNRVGG
jgi:selenocysteine lyase/cysteine desulfurase